MENTELLTLQKIRTMLLVTTDRSTRHQLHQFFHRDDYQLVDCTESDQLRQLIIETIPDVILLDEDMSGQGADLAIAHWLQANFPVVPFVMILSEDSDARISRALDAGALDYITRPLREVVVCQRLQYLLHTQAIQQDLRAREERYRVIVSLTSDYAYAYDVDPDGSLVNEWSTNSFEVITGFPVEETNRDGWKKLIHPDDVAITQNRYERLIAGEKDITEYRIITRDGQVRWLQDHGYPVYDETLGRVVRIYGAAKDITESKIAEQLLWKQTSELQERNQELDAFAHTVAHDLKNPIASMMGFTSLVLNYYHRMTDDQVKEYLALIMEGGYKLKEIVNSLLLLASVSKLEQIELEPLEMSSIIQQTRRRLMTMITESQAEINEPERYPLAMGYAPWVEEIWANYLSNALKYGGKPPRIEFGAEELDNGMVRFWICDNGKGLTPAEQERVFTPFIRLSQANIEGHGLGLSVVHTIVDKLGGTAAVENSYTGGCKFSFTLPAFPA